jgi:lysophospholipase L1-like esterase
MIDLRYKIFTLLILCITKTYGQSYCCYGGNAQLSGNTQSIQSKVQLQNALHRPLRIVHIGDSHTQPGIFSLPTTEMLNDCMPNGGYGNAFPYSVAKTNGQDAYKTVSDAQWQSARIIQTQPNFPVGLAGYTLHTMDIEAEISWDFDTTQIQNAVQRITVYHASTADSNYFYQFLDYDGNKARYLPQLSHDHQSVFEFNRPVWNFTMSHLRFHEYQKSSTLYGVFVENGQMGFINTSIGINGATYDHFLKADRFRNQLENTEPDIIVVSLGTNEAFQNEEFKDSLMYLQVDEMIQMLGSLKSNPAIILVTPPAVSKQTYKKGKSYFVPHPNVPIIRKIILDVAEWNQLAVFDLYEVMGGELSMKQWAERGLTDKKQIHFSPSGYRELGESFAEAICHLLLH